MDAFCLRRERRLARGFARRTDAFSGYRRCNKTECPLSSFSFCLTWMAPSFGSFFTFKQRATGLNQLLAIDCFSAFEGFHKENMLNAVIKEQLLRDQLEGHRGRMTSNLSRYRSVIYLLSCYFNMKLHYRIHVIVENEENRSKKSWCRP